jgi:cell division septation protein DedD
MKRADFKKPSQVFYIGKGLIIGSVVITASLGFLLGFFVGKKTYPLSETTPEIAVSVQEKVAEENAKGTPVREPLQEPSQAAQMPGQEKSMQTAQDQSSPESHTIPPVRTPASNLRTTGFSSSGKGQIQGASQSAGKTEQAQATKSVPVSTEKKDAKTPQDKQESPKTTAIRKYTVQVGAFKNAEEADALRTKMSKKGYKAFVTAAKTKKQEILHKVMVGEYRTRQEAEVLSVKLKNSEGLRTFVTFVMQEGATRQQ